MANWIAVEKARARLRHAVEVAVVVSSSLSKRDGGMERIAQNKYVCSCWFARHTN